MVCRSLIYHSFSFLKIQEISKVYILILLISFVLFSFGLYTLSWWYFIKCCCLKMSFSSLFLRNFHIHSEISECQISLLQKNLHTSDFPVLFLSCLLKISMRVLFIYHSEKKYFFLTVDSIFWFSNSCKTFDSAKSTNSHFDRLFSPYCYDFLLWKSHGNILALTLFTCISLP